jgi:hypothetical protein
LNEVEGFGVFVVALVGKNGKWGVKVWGKEKFGDRDRKTWHHLTLFGD